MVARERLPMGRDVVRGAAIRGHIKVLNWARANGCPWNAETCGYAAMSGGKTLLFCTARDGHDAVVWALIELGARQPGDG